MVFCMYYSVILKLQTRRGSVVSHVIFVVGSSRATVGFSYWKEIAEHEFRINKDPKHGFSICDLFSSLRGASLGLLG